MSRVYLNRFTREIRPMEGTCMHASLSKPIATSLLALALAISGAALIGNAPAAARTVCHPDGRCFNTSGAPIYNGPGWHHHYPPYYHHHHDENGY
jgi:hypothetical protein